MPANITVDFDGDLITPKELLKALHDHSEELALMEAENVRDRTPVMTGALRESVSWEGSKGNVGPSRLATVWYDDEPQLFEWHRVYMPYQEGPPLGLSTYTNEPRQMLLRSETEDLEYIDGWAQSVVKDLEGRAKAESFAGHLEAWLALFAGSEE